MSSKFMVMFRGKPYLRLIEIARMKQSRPVPVVAFLMQTNRVRACRYQNRALVEVALNSAHQNWQFLRAIYISAELTEQVPVASNQAMEDSIGSLLYAIVYEHTATSEFRSLHEGRAFPASAELSPEREVFLNAFCMVLDSREALRKAERQALFQISSQFGLNDPGILALKDYLEASIQLSCAGQTVENAGGNADFRETYFPHEIAVRDNDLFEASVTKRKAHDAFVDARIRFCRHGRNSKSVLILGLARYLSAVQNLWISEWNASDSEGWQLEASLVDRRRAIESDRLRELQELSRQCEPVFAHASCN